MKQSPNLVTLKVWTSCPQNLTRDGSPEGATGSPTEQGNAGKHREMQGNTGKCSTLQFPVHFFFFWLWLSQKIFFLVLVQEFIEVVKVPCGSLLFPAFPCGFLEFPSLPNQITQNQPKIQCIHTKWLTQCLSTLFLPSKSHYFMKQMRNTFRLSNKSLQKSPKSIKIHLLFWPSSLKTFTT